MNKFKGGKESMYVVDLYIQYILVYFKTGVHLRREICSFIYYKMYCQPDLYQV